MNIKDEIIKYAKEINIDEIGFASLNPFLSDELILQKRRDEENYTEFEELDINRRVYPKELFEFGKSAIVITEYYGNFDKVTEIPDDRGKLSISAHGTDYHRILKNKLIELGEFIKNRYGIAYLPQVDTNPLLERSMAVRSGLGWIGKNTCFYSNKFGSFVFIGILIISEDLANFEENEFFSRCMNCSICIENCPTGAISKDGYCLDIKKCISYNTVTKDNFNFEIAEKLRGSLYGCDVCQMKCPQNVDIKGSDKGYFKGSYDENYPELVNVLSNSNSQYKRIYEKNAVFWRGNKILKRNALLALMQMEDKEKVLEIIDKFYEKYGDYFKEYLDFVRDRVKRSN